MSGRTPSATAQHGAPAGRSTRGRALDVGQELLEAFARGARVTEYLVAGLPPEVWHAPATSGKGRTIAAMVVHMQSVRRTFAKEAAGDGGGKRLDRVSVTQVEALRALEQSREALVASFGAALARGDPRVEGMPRRAVDMIAYLMQHDAHHRGQITRQARELGHKLSDDDVMRVWGWKKLP